MKSIIFSAPMIRALLAGTKTQTRRLVRIDDTPISKEDFDALRRQRGIPSNAVNVRMLGYLKCDAPPGSATVSSRVECPYVDPMEPDASKRRLWVRESVKRDPDNPNRARYFADDWPCPYLDAWPWKCERLSSIYMPWGLRRLEIEVTNVRVQRLQDITEEDAIAEGAKAFGKNPEGDCWTDGQARTAFEYGWNELHGWNPNAWALNPYVWALTFTVHHREEE